MEDLTPEEREHMKALCNVFIANTKVFAEAVEECLNPSQMLTMSHLERMPSGAQIREIYANRKPRPPKSPEEA